MHCFMMSGLKSFLGLSTVHGLADKLIFEEIFVTAVMHVLVIRLSPLMLEHLCFHVSKRRGKQDGVRITLTVS